MIYIIDGNISFDTNDYTIHHGDISEIVKLTIPAGRLLETLLGYGYGVVSREYLLEFVWDRHGLRGSNNNLNQYLSIIRRILADFGCESFIITIPKIGVKLNEGVSLYIVIGSEDNVYHDITLGLPSNKLEGNPRRKNIKESIVRLILISIFLFFFLYYYLVKIKKGENISFEMSDGCNIELLRGFSMTEIPEIKKKITKIIKDNNFVCNKKSTIYFDYYTTSDPKNFGRTLLSCCSLDDNKKTTLCNNIYYDNWILK